MASGVVLMAIASIMYNKPSQDDPTCLKLDRAALLNVSQKLSSWIYGNNIAVSEKKRFTRRITSSSGGSCAAVGADADGHVLGGLKGSGVDGREMTS